jgi:hypothetical protein
MVKGPTGRCSVNYSIPAILKFPEGIVLMEQKYDIEVVGPTPAETGRLTAELSALLPKIAPGIQANRSKLPSDTLELGTTIGIVFGSAYAAAVGRGIGAWLTKRQTAELTLKTPDGQTIVKGVTSADLVKIIEILAPEPGEEANN